MITVTLVKNTLDFPYTNMLIPKAAGSPLVSYGREQIPSAAKAYVSHICSPLTVLCSHSTRSPNHPILKRPFELSFVHMRGLPGTTGADLNGTVHSKNRIITHNVKKGAAISDSSQADKAGAAKEFLSTMSSTCQSSSKNASPARSQRA